MKKIALIIMIIGIVLFLSSCLATDEIIQTQKPAGFLLGIWHGWIAPFSLILGLFMDGVRIYSPYNTGWWYDAGFYMAIISGFGGLSLIRRKKSNDR
jgi:hypothetical protein